MAKSENANTEGSVATIDRKKGPSRKTGGRPMSESGGAQSIARRQARDKRSFFEIYKPGQGYYTRICTAIGGGILILGAGNFAFKQLDGVVADAQAGLWLQVIASSVIVIGLGLLLYWLVGVRRGSSDFLIATEGEMKKVSWSNSDELIGSTKVVIAATIFLGSMLFVIDLIFLKFFQFIGVLQSGG